MIKNDWRAGLALAALMVTAMASAAAQGDGVQANAILKGCGSGDVHGFAVLREHPSAEGVKAVDITLFVTGLSDGKHAVHIHEKGACEPCGDAGGHFDPGPNSNSNPDGNHPFHMGDLINIEVKDGVGVLHTTTTRVTLSAGPLSVFDENGSAFIVHTNEDTYCPGGPEKGCAGGSREACGIIEHLQ